MEDQVAKRARVAAEILSTERSYIESLSTIIELYIKPLADNPKLLGPKERAEIFNNIEQIYDLNSRFCVALEAAIDDYSQLGNVFVEYFPWFKMYIDYCNGHSHAVVQFREQCEKKEALRQFEQNAMMNPKAKGLSLESFLIMPIQRIPRYKLLLTEVIKLTHNQAPEFSVLTKACEVTENLASKINEEIRNRERRDKALELQKMFTGDVPELLAPGRYYVMEGELMKICRKADKPFCFFLFSDLLVYGRKGTRPGTYVLHREIPINAAFMAIDLKQSEKYAIEIRNSQKSFVVYTFSFEEKMKWFDAFQNCIREVNNKMNNKRDSEAVAPIWAPDKSSKKCFICDKQFSMINRRHHCRRCGKLVCGACSKARLQLQDSGEKVRVCDLCFKELKSSQEDGNEPTLAGAITSPKSNPMQKLFNVKLENELKSVLSSRKQILSPKSSKEDLNHSDDSSDDDDNIISPPNISNVSALTKSTGDLSIGFHKRINSSSAQSNELKLKTAPIPRAGIEKSLASNTQKPQYEPRSLNSLFPKKDLNSQPMQKSTVKGAKAAPISEYKSTSSEMAPPEADYDNFWEELKDDRDRTHVVLHSSSVEYDSDDAKEPLDSGHFSPPPLKKQISPKPLAGKGKNEQEENLKSQNSAMKNPKESSSSPSDRNSKPEALSPKPPTKEYLVKDKPKPPVPPPRKLSFRDAVVAGESSNALKNSPQTAEPVPPKPNIGPKPSPSLNTPESFSPKPSVPRKSSRTNNQAEPSPPTARKSSRASNPQSSPDSVPPKQLFSPKPPPPRKSSRASNPQSSSSEPSKLSSPTSSNKLIAIRDNSFSDPNLCLKYQKGDEAILRMKKPDMIFIELLSTRASGWANPLDFKSK